MEAVFWISNVQRCYVNKQEELVSCHSLPQSFPCAPLAHAHITCQSLNNSLSSRSSHTAKDTSSLSCWESLPWGEHGLLDRLHIHTLSTPSHSHGAVPHSSHAANNNTHVVTAMKDPEDQCHFIHRPYSSNGVLFTVDDAAHLTSSPCCRGTGCSPMSTAGGGSSNIYGSGELYMHSDMQEISNDARITNMRDKAII